MSKGRHKTVLVLRRRSGYPIEAFPDTPSGLRYASKCMLEIAERWRRLGVDDEPDVARFRLVEIESCVEP